MAVQVVELPQQPQAFGLSDLGAALQQGAAGYVQDQQQQKARAAQLSDVQSARDYQTQRDDSEHAFQEADFDHRQAALAKADELRSKGELQKVFVEALVQHGYLTPTDAQDPAKLQAASARAMNDGLIQKFSDLINHGYLAVDDIDKPDAVLAAQKKAAAQSTDAFNSTIEGRKNSVVSATAVFNQHQHTLAHINAVEAAASLDPQVEAQKALDPKVVQAKAVELARAANPGLKDAQLGPKIAEQMAPAEQAIRQQVFIQAQQRLSQAKAILPSLQRMYSSEESRLGQFEKMGVSPDPSTSDDQEVGPAPIGDEAAAPTGTPPVAAQRAAFASLAGGPGAGGLGSGVTPPPVAAPPPSPYQGMLSDQGADPAGAAIIGQENARRAASALAEAHQKIDQPIQQTAAQLSQIQQQIQKAKSDPNFGVPSIPFGYGAMSTGAMDPGNQAKALTDLYAQATALTQKLQALQKQKQALSASETVGQPATGSTMSVPAASDSNGSMPSLPAGQNWWGAAAGQQAGLASP